MSNYLAPGVNIEEVRSGPRDIEGVSTSTAGFVGETERGPTTPTLVSSWQDFSSWFGDDIDRRQNAQNVFLPYAARGFFDNGGLKLYIARVVGPAAVAAAADLGNCLVQAIGPGAWGNNLFIAVKKAAGSTPGTETADWFRLQIAYYRDGIAANFVDPTSLQQLADPERGEPTAFEDYDNLSAVSTDANSAASVINRSSRLLRVISCTSRPLDVSFPDARLDNGESDPASLADFLGEDTSDLEPRRGLAGLSAIRDISLVAAPDEVVVPGLREKVIEACETLKDRFAVVGVDGNVANIVNLSPPRDTAYGAFYCPWIRVAAPHTAEGDRLIPPVGHVTGIYARVDTERGVHKAPANEVVRGILTRDLAPDKQPLEFALGKREQDILNPRGVNVIRDFRSDGHGIRVFGARTMSSDVVWKYVNVRRLFIFIEQSVGRGTQWVVFEPNVETTWSAVRTSITGFLRTLWRNGALMGTTEDEAFFVKCDLTTMTQDDIDNGRLICVIGIAVVRPAEYVIFRISQKTMEGAKP